MRKAVVLSLAVATMAAGFVMAVEACAAEKPVAAAEDAKLLDLAGEVARELGRK